jgi:hypothetical protein
LRLLRRGLDAEAIVQRAEERRARLAMRTEGVTTAVNGGVNGHADGETNGFPVIPIPPFSQSEAKKEFHLAELRALEVARQKGELVAIQPFRAITDSVLKFQRDCIALWPTDLAHDLTMRTQAECAELLRRRVEHLFHSTAAFLEAECKKYGIILPPPPPERPRLRLAYYERYVRDSRTGQIETIPREEDIDSERWRLQHPSITFQQSFEILRKKREWDAAMGELLARRVEWDLAPEVVEVVEPPPSDD